MLQKLLNFQLSKARLVFCDMLYACRKFNQFNPLTPKIASVILLSVHDIVPVM